MANGVVVGGALYCRKNTNTTDGYWGQFASGSLISITAITGNSDWWKTTWTNGSTGYVMKAYVVSAGDTIQIKGTSVNVRPTAGTSGDPLYQVSNPTTSSVLDVGSASDGGWIKIQPSGKSAGWVRFDYVTKTASGSGGGDPGDGGTTPGTTAAPTLAQVREGTHYFKLGDYGTSVTSLRSLVTGKGISCGSGNVYDQTLKSAITTFQNRHSILAKDGLCGQGTLAILEDDENMSGWFNEGATSNRCKLTAGKLIKIGFTGAHILSPSIVSSLNAMINDSRFKFTTKIQVRHLLAQARAEIGEGTWGQFTEGSYAEGSTTKHGGYFGSGMLQLTHDYNYKNFKAALYPNDSSIYPNAGYAPYHVARNYPFISAGWFWQYEKGLNPKLAPGGAWYSLSADATVKNVTDAVKGSTDTYPARSTMYTNIGKILL